MDWKLVLVISFLLVSGASAEDFSEPADAHGWIEIATDHFRVYSNAGTMLTTGLAHRLEEIRAVLMETIGYESFTARPLHIIVFATDASFSPYAMSDHTGGFYHRAPDAAYIAVSADPRWDPSRLIIHEYVHAVLADHIPDAPLWFNEGLAEFFESISVDGATARIGLPLKDRLLQLKRASLIPMDVFLAVDRQSPYYTGAEEKDRYYAQSWALVHALLLRSDTGTRGWQRLLGIIEQDPPDERALRTILGLETSTLEAYIGGYLQEDVLAQRVVEIPKIASYVPSVRTVAPAEALTLLGRLMTARNPPEIEAAAENYRRALHLDPRFARGHAGIGALAALDDRLVEAEAAFEHAVALDPDDAWIRYRLGAFLFHRTTSWQRAIEELETSVTLDPIFGPAWAVLAAAYAERRPADTPILETAETAHRLLPTDPEVSRALLTLRLDADLRDEAQDLVEATTAPDSPARRNAIASLITNDLLRARQNLVAGDLEVAAARLTRAEAEIDGASNPGRLVLEIREIERLILRAGFARSIEDAERLHRGGDSQAALDLLDEVLASEPDGQITNSAQAMQWRILNPGKPLPARFLGPLTTLTSKGEMDTLNRHIAAGEYNAALAVLQELDGRVSAADRSWIDVKIEEIRFALAHNRFAGDYNRAVDAFNSGDRRLAETILVGLVGDLPPGPEADRAWAFLGRITNVGDGLN
jgi:tetratricopeptide (TPR) repeat protein